MFLVVLKELREWLVEEGWWVWSLPAGLLVLGWMVSHYCQLSWGGDLSDGYQSTGKAA